MKGWRGVFPRKGGVIGGDWEGHPGVREGHLRAV